VDPRVELTSVVLATGTLSSASAFKGRQAFASTSFPGERSEALECWDAEQHLLGHQHSAREQNQGRKARLRNRKRGAQKNYNKT
jgi:hypothetical protein